MRRVREKKYEGELLESLYPIGHGFSQHGMTLFFFVYALAPPSPRGAFFSLGKDKAWNSNDIEEKSANYIRPGAVDHFQT